MSGKTVGHTDFSPQEIDRALLALAIAGTSTQALKLLEEDNQIHRLPTARCLNLWKQEHAERFREIQTQQAPQVEADSVHDYRVIVRRTNQIHLAGLDQTAAGLPDLDAKDAAAAVKNLAIAGGVAADKLLVFTDRPNVIHSKPDPEHVLAGIARAFGIKSIDSTADDITHEPEPPQTRPLIPESSRINARETPARPAEIPL